MTESSSVLPSAQQDQIAQVLDIRDYTAAPYLVLATRSGMVKKTRFTEYDSSRRDGLIDDVEAYLPPHTPEIDSGHAAFDVDDTGLCRVRHGCHYRHR